MSLSIITSAFDILFQPNCLVCKSYSKSEICHRCHLPETKIILIDPDNFDHKVKKFNAVRNFYSFWKYSENVRDLCIAIKFDPSPKLIRILARHLAPSISELLEAKLWDKIVSVPASNSGYSKRGFNHVTLLITELIKQAGIDRSILIEPLENFNHREPQSKLSQRKRIEAISKRYKLRSNFNLENLNILLVDDILTTGSTLTAAALALKKAGAKNVDALTVCYNEFQLIRFEEGSLK